ncbi:MAG: LysM peptidoglycan-binding domain-containing protein [Verrucomicrobiota bacterium]|nr:LysM peptidoglycan-binding domain-containing protein [Verrucomicrobiota bacterium]
MKTSWVMSIVAAAHVAAIGSAVLIQGCGTPEEPKMPSTTTPAPVTKSREPVARPPGAFKEPTTTYVVVSSDTLSGIARRLNVAVAEIVVLNNITNPNRLKVGQKLLIPGKICAGAAQPAPRPKQAPATPPSAAKIEPVAPAPALDPAPAAVVSAEEWPITKAPKPFPPVKSRVRTLNYTVQPGETLRTIAMNRALSVSRLREINDIPEGVEVKAGQVVRIPLPE